MTNDRADITKGIQTIARGDQGAIYSFNQSQTANDMLTETRGTVSPSVTEQQSFWNGWNDGIWKGGRGEISRRQAEIDLGK